jgi:hypothetical protein
LQQLEQYQPTADPPPLPNTDEEMEEHEQELEHEHLPKQHKIQVAQQQDHFNTGANQQQHIGTTGPSLEGTSPHGVT